MNRVLLAVTAASRAALGRSDRADDTDGKAELPPA